MSPAIDADARRRTRRALRRLVGVVEAGRSEPGVDARVEEWLYERWYAVPHPMPTRPPIVPGRESLLTVLRAAGGCAIRFEADWVALGTNPQGHCVAGRAETVRVAAPGDYVNLARGAVPVAPGDRVAVLDRRDWVDEPTGFWGLRSAAGEPSPPLVRLYLSVAHDRIGTVIRRLAAALGSVDARWSLKCPVAAEQFDRVDSLVVYVSAGAWTERRAKILASVCDLAPELRPAIPPLTLPLARGVAFAESPPAGRSFGLDRCHALAPGVREMLSRPAVPAARGLALLEASLVAAGVALDRPWACV